MSGPFVFCTLALIVVATFFLTLEPVPGSGTSGPIDFTGSFNVRF